MPANTSAQDLSELTTELPVDFEIRPRISLVHSQQGSLNHCISAYKLFALLNAYCPPRIFSRLKSQIAISLSSPEINLLEIGHHSAMPIGACLPRDERELIRFFGNALESEILFWLAALAKPSSKNQILSEFFQTRMLTLNVWGCSPLMGFGSADPERFPKIGSAIERESVDIVALQEMWDPRTACILKSAGLPFIAAAPGAMTGVVTRPGLVTLSRYPLLHSRWFPFRSVRGLERLTQKGVLHTRHRHPSGHEIDIFNVHLISEPESFNRIFLSNATFELLRGEQIRQLFKIVEQNSGLSSIVGVLGDFNVPDTGSAYWQLRERFGCDLFQRYSYLQARLALSGVPAMDPGYTFCPDTNPYAKSPHMRSERLDYLFIKKALPTGLGLRAARVFDVLPLSDHYGVLADCYF